MRGVGRRGYAVHRCSSWQTNRCQSYDLIRIKRKVSWYSEGFINSWDRGGVTRPPLQVINTSATRRRSEFPRERKKKYMQHESPLIIHLCCVSVWYDKSISIILHTDRDSFCTLHLRVWLSVSHRHKRVRWI